MPTVRLSRCLALACITTIAAGCAAEEDDPVLDGVEVSLADAKEDSDATVETYLKRIPCSTEVIRALSQQIIDEIECLTPGSLVPVGEAEGITLLDGSVLAYLHPDAATALRKVALKKPITVASSMRTVAQQFLLSEWARAKKCSITKAAPAGMSQHEVGRAVDIRTPSTLKKYMVAEGWVQEDPIIDPVHFAYLKGAGAEPKDVLAFQRLWNRNAQAWEQIAETGTFDETTKKALRRAPAAGFPEGAACGQRPASEGPAEAANPTPE